ncbi:MAG: leucine-rich repeat domain-containing protein [Ruminococcus flavefaciens]|nr:leucine-rich repeat domain-containing protein [Ruminococcus flavefaciens]
MGDWAFYNCTSLTSINIPDSVTKIGNEAFKNCTSLKEIVFCNITINVSEIEKDNEIASDALRMLCNKDFSIPLISNIKFKLVMDYFFCTDDEDTKAYIKKMFLRIMKHFIENGYTDIINKILEKTDFVTERNIDKFITHATNNKQQEVYNILTDYKNANF